MVDCETLSLKSNAAILQIGVVGFNDKRILSLKKFGIWPPEGKTDFDTIRWWFEQIEAGVKSPIMLEARPLYHVLDGVSSVLIDLETIWSHGAIDITWLENAFRRCKMKTPWSYKQVRDTRTLAQLCPQVERIEPVSPHDALADALAQAEWVIKMTEDLNERLSNNGRNRPS